MASNKRIEFNASINAQSFNKELDRIEKKLKQVGRDIGITAGLAKVQPQLKNLGINIDKSTSSMFGEKAKKGMRDLENHIKKQIKDIQTLNNIQGQRDNKIKTFQNSLKGLNKESNTFKDIQQSIINLQERQTKNLTTQEAKMSSILKRTGQIKTINQAMGGGGGGGGGPMGSLGKIATGVARIGGRVGFVAAAIAAPVTIGASAGAEYYQYKIDQRRIRSQSRADTIRGSQRSIRAFLDGRGAEEMMLQRTGVLKKSLGQARATVDEERSKDKLRLAAGLSGVAAATVAGAGSGIIPGAILGQGIPLFGALPGAIVGGGIGGLTAGGYALAKLAQTRYGKSLLDKQTYNAQIQKLTVDNFNKYRDDNKEAFALQMRGMNYMKDRSPSYLKAQRILGFGDVDMFGGTRTTGPMADPNQAFRQTSIAGLLNENDDFTEQDVLGTAGNIATVGGARGINRNTRAALLARRNRNMMGAGNIIGQLQAIGGQGSEEFKKILAEGMTIGLDNSNMAREQEKFATAVSAVVFQQGTGADAGRMASMMAIMAGDSPTMRNLTSLSPSMQALTALTKNTKGIRGMQQAAGIEREFSGTSTFGKLAIQNTSIEDLMADSPRIKALAKESGLGTDEFRKKALRIKIESFVVTEQGQKALERLRSGKLDKEGRDRDRRALRFGMEATSSVFARLTPEAQERLLNYMELGKLSELTDFSKINLRGKGRGRLGDITERAEAAKQRVLRGLSPLSTVKGDIEASGRMAPLTIRFGDKLNEALENTEEKGNAAATALGNMLEAMQKIIDQGESVSGGGSPSNSQSTLDFLGIGQNGMFSPNQSKPQEGSK